MNSANWTEIENLNAFVSKLNGRGRIKVLNKIQAGRHEIPIYGVVIGTENKSVPTLGIFGGVHGLERVGSHVVLNHLSTLLSQLAWDQDLQSLFERFRLVSIPIVNPGGMVLNQRSNPRGVDIMRNAPVEAVGDLQPLVSGHRISNSLPWFRGHENEPMEIETQSLVDFVKEEMLGSQFSIALDIHSGFGMRDRLWYPYSKTKEDFPYKPLVQKMISTMDATLPFHIYKIEPQATSYMIHGDPWDYLFDFHMEKYAADGRVFIPWCLEMGSWTWLKKNPRQLFYRGGIFNPILPHRYGRIMRRHKPLLDFLKSAVINFKNWT